MGVPYSIFCCFKSTTEARLIDLEAGGGGGGTYSTDVNTMLASANNDAIRSAIGVGTTDTTTFARLSLNSAVSSLYFKSATGVERGFFYTDSGGYINYRFGLSGGQFVMQGAAGVAATNNGLVWLSATELWTEGANVLAQRRGSAAQAFRVYNNFISSTVYERAVMGWNATTGNLNIGTEFLGGSGMAAKQIDFVTGGAVRMSIAAAGNLGVGISAPVAKLDVLFPTSSTGLNLASNAATSVSNFLTWSTAWGSLSGGIKSSDVGGGWNTQIYSSSKISLSAGGADLPDLTIDSAGLVGIGTTTPAAKLDIVGSTGDILLLKNATQPVLTVYSGGGSGSISINHANSPSLVINQSTGNKITLGVGSNNLSATTSLGAPIDFIIQGAGGNVGIGNATPAAKLDTAETWNAPALAVTGASGTGSTATLTFATQLTAIPVGSTIVVAGVTPSGYNGTFIVTGSTTSTVLYANATTAAGTGGTIERVFTSVKLNVTDTASNAASLLMDLQVDGVSKIKAGKNGNLLIGSIGSTSGSLFINSSSVGGATIYGSTRIQAGPLNFNGNTYLYEDAAGILAQRNGTTAQAFRVYNTFPGTTANEWFEIDWKTTANSVRIGTNQAGTGGTRQMILTGGGGSTPGFQFNVGAAATWIIDAAGAFKAGFDNTYDIGASGANRPRNLFLAGSIFVATNITAVATVEGTQVIKTSATGYIAIAGRIGMTSPSDGILNLSDNAGTSFGRLQLGGTTSAFPAIKRNGTGIDIRLADDSAFAPISSLYQRFGSGTPEGAVTAPTGAVFHRTDGGSGSSFYVKESGSGPNGWVAK